MQQSGSSSSVAAAAAEAEEEEATRGVAVEKLETVKKWGLNTYKVPSCSHVKSFLLGFSKVAAASTGCTTFLIMKHICVRAP